MNAKLLQAPNRIQTPKTNRLLKPETRSANAIQIRTLHLMTDMEKIYRMAYDAYRENNYCRASINRSLIHYPKLEGIPETTVLGAFDGDNLLGSVSLTMDGPAGLHVDRDYSAETQEIRNEGQRLASSWRIVTKRECRTNRQIVMVLIGAVVKLAFHTNQRDTLLCIFNPRHARIYQRLLNMKVLASREETKGLHNAPSVLMRCDADRCPGRWM